jgi:hypothetical protein
MPPLGVRGEREREREGKRESWRERERGREIEIEIEIERNARMPETADGPFSTVAAVGIRAASRRDQNVIP